MSKIIVDTIESTGATVTVNDALTSTGNIDAGTNTVTAGTVTGITASSLTSGTLAAARLPSMDITASTGDVTITGALPSTITFAGAGVAAKVYYKDQSTSTTSYNGGTTFAATGHGFYHAFTSGKTYIVAADLNVYTSANGYEWNTYGLHLLYTDPNSTTIPSSGTTSLPGTSQAISQSNIGMRGTANGSWEVGKYGVFSTLPFAGTGTTDVFYLAVRSYNSNVTIETKGVKWFVYEFDTAPGTTTG